MRRGTALRQRGHGQPAVHRGNLAGQARAVVDNLVAPPLLRQGLNGPAPGQAGLFVHRDRQRIASPELELRRAQPDHGLMKQQGPAPRVVARDERQIEFTPRHTRDEGGRLFAVEFDLAPAVLRRKALEHRREVAGGIVIRHAQSHATRQLVAMQGAQGLGLQIQDASRVPQQHLAILSQQQLAWPPVEQPTAHGFLQLLELHADGRLRPVHLSGGARERARVHHGDKALQPVDLEVLQHCRLLSIR